MDRYERLLRVHKQNFSKTKSSVRSVRDPENKDLFEWLINAKNAQNTEIKGLDSQESDALEKAKSDYGRSYQIDYSKLKNFERYQKFYIFGQSFENKRPVLVTEIIGSFEEGKHT